MNTGFVTGGQIARYVDKTLLQGRRSRVWALKARGGGLGRSSTP
jgi:hypothetical protein